jgi:hypothetical protein
LEYEKAEMSRHIYLLKKISEKKDRHIKELQVKLDNNREKSQ